MSDPTRYPRPAIGADLHHDAPPPESLGLYSEIEFGQVHTGGSLIVDPIGQPDHHAKGRERMEHDA